MGTRNKNEVEGAGSRRSWSAYIYIALTIVVVSSGLNWLQGIQVKEQKAVVQNNSAVQAQTNLESDICRTTPNEPLCEVARIVLENPTEPVKPVPGPQGPQGKQGLKGDKGEPGEPGRQGKEGKTGRPGDDGIDGSTITGMSCTGGTLTLTYVTGGTKGSVSTDVVCDLPNVKDSAPEPATDS